jgi:hypothetical protein
MAEALYCLLPQVIQSITPWMSSEDISAGTWSSIAGELEAAHFVVICISPDNVNAPWLQFEAGALSKQFAAASVCRYIFGSTELTGPLAQFQAVRADREGTYSLLRAVNEAAGENKLPTAQLEQAFKVWWPRLQKELANTIANSNWTRATRKNEDAIPREKEQQVGGLVSLGMDNNALAQVMLEGFPKGDREILHARWFENRSDDDVCKQFGVHRDYLRVLMHRAINRVGDLYRKKRSN